MIYLDNNATTKIDPRVLEAMMPFLTDNYANAASTHIMGVDANASVRSSREIIADLLKCQTNEIIFTSGATEAINLAIKGVTYVSNKKKHVVTVATEHSAVLDTCKQLETQGFEITYLSVDSSGLVNIEELKSSITRNTLLVSVMFVNNEIGVIQPIKEISSIAHYNGAYFMTDATQAVGKMPINVDELGIDLMSFSGHKIYGPKGVGGLFVRKRHQNKVKIDALQHGGGHEFGLRSGTLNVPGIVGLGKALEIAVKDMEKDEKRIRSLRDKLENELLKIEGAVINGHKENRIFTTSNICFSGIDSDAVMAGLDDIAISKGSACSSDSIDPSHVLKAIGLSDDDAFSSLRFGVGRFNTEEEIDQVIFHINKIIADLLKY